MKVLDLFSAAAGGWSLGMHRAGFVTVAACENVEWRRILYAENNPNVRLYDDVRTLSAIQLVRDLGYLPDVIVGSPPCQDISSANTKGRGVEGERSGLFFEAVRIIGEVRPRWFALENSHNLRTRGADAVLAALEAIDYACWPLVVRASDIGANHERPRSWLVGCDPAQLAAHSYQDGQFSRAFDGEVEKLSGMGNHLNAAGFGYEGGRAWGHGPDGDGAAHAGDPSQDGRRQGFSGRCAEPASRAQFAPCGDAANANKDEIRQPELPGRSEPETPVSGQPDRPGLARNTPNPNQAGQADGCLEPGLRQEKISDHGRRDGRGADGSGAGQMAVCPPDRGGADGPWPLWSLDDLAGRLRLDDGLPGRVAGTRVAVGGPKGTAAPSLIVEAYGDAVVPQIPEAIGRAILRVEAALAAIYPERQAA